MSVEQIQKMYDNMYSSKYNDLIKAKNESLSDLDKQEAENKDNFYNQRNQAAVDNASNRRQVRDWMAKNNLLQSGESVDALLRGNTDYSNSMGSIASNEAKYKNELANSRNKINNEFNGNVAAAKAEIEAQKIQSILEYQQQQEQLELQKQQLAASRAASSRSSSSSSKYTKSQAKEDLRYEYAYALRSGDYNQLAAVGSAMKEAYGNGYLTQKEYNDYMSGINSSIDSLKRSEVKVNNGTYGYSTAPRNNAKSYTSYKNSTSSKKSKKSKK